MQRVFKIFGVAICIFAGLFFTLLALGAFANMSSSSPLILRSFGSIENILLQGVKVSPMLQAIFLAFTASLMLGFGTYLKYLPTR